jgi:hypothetical protein
MINLGRTKNHLSNYTTATLVLQPSDISPDYRIIVLIRRNIMLHTAYIIHTNI